MTVNPLSSELTKLLRDISPVLLFKIIELRDQANTTIEDLEGFAETTSESITINSDLDDSDIQLIFGRTTGGNATLQWNGTTFTLDRPFSLPSLTDGYIPYHHSDTLGLEDSPISIAGNDLLIGATGDIILDPTGNDVYPNTNYDLNLGLINKKFLTLHAAELWVENLVAQNVMATIGGRIVIAPTTELTSDLTAEATTIYVKHNNLSNGDIIYLESNGNVEFMSVDSAAGGTGPYSYTVTRDKDGSGANAWYAGDAVLNMGTTGDGFIDIYSVRGVKEASDYGPTIVGNIRNSATYNDWTEAWAVGNLNGIYGYSADIYGAAFGKYSASDYITIEPTNGIRFLDADDVVQAQLASGVWTMGRVAEGYSNIQITSGALKLRNNETDILSISTAGISSFNMTAGSDITFTGDDSNPGKLIWDGSSYDMEVWGNTAGSAFYIKPTTDAVSGSPHLWIGTTGNRWGSITLMGENHTTIYGYYDSDDYAKIYVDGGNNTSDIIFTYERNGSTYSFTASELYALLHP